MLIISQIQEIRNNLSRLLGKVKVTDGAGNDMPAMDAAGRAGFVKVTDGSNTMPSGDAVSRKIFVSHTDGTNLTPAMDDAARAGFQKITDGTNTLKVTKTDRGINTFFFPSLSYRKRNDHGTVTADWSVDTSSNVSQRAGYDLHITGVSLWTYTSDPTSEIITQPIPFLVALRDITDGNVWLAGGCIPTTQHFNLSGMGLKIKAGATWVSDIRLGGATNMVVYVEVFCFEEEL